MTDVTITSRRPARPWLERPRGRGPISFCSSLLASITASLVPALAVSFTGFLIAAPARAANANPDLSVNALFLYRNSNRGNDLNLANRNGFDVQEAEMQFISDVDPYWRLNALFSMEKEVDADKQKLTPSQYDAKWKFSPEEAYAETLDFPVVTLKVGKFKAALGKHNQLHTHAFPFIDAPLINQILLGDEGLNDVGASTAFLFPTPWFSELTLQALSGQFSDSSYFQTTSPVAIAHFKNLWELSDELTSELGLSAATGQNTALNSTRFFGADLTFKWRTSLERAVIFATEYLRREVPTSSLEVGQGVASWVQFQLNRRIWLQARGEYFQLADASTRKQSVLAAFDPSEFSEVRIEYDHVRDANPVDEHRTLLQFNYTIGAHPAHSY